MKLCTKSCRARCIYEHTRASATPARDEGRFPSNEAPDCHRCVDVAPRRLDLHSQNLVRAREILLHLLHGIRYAFVVAGRDRSIYVNYIAMNSYRCRDRVVREHAKHQWKQDAPRQPLSKIKAARCPRVGLATYDALQLTSAPVDAYGVVHHGPLHDLVSEGVRLAATISSRADGGIEIPSRSRTVASGSVTKARSWPPAVSDRSPAERPLLHPTRSPAGDTGETIPAPAARGKDRASFGGRVGGRWPQRPGDLCRH
jgi:hypothetical protein